MKNAKTPFAKQTIVGCNMKEHQLAGRCHVLMSQEMFRGFLGPVRHGLSPGLPMCLAGTWLQDESLGFGGTAGLPSCCCTTSAADELGVSHF